MKLYSVLLLILCIAMSAEAVATLNGIGASITYGATLSDRQHNSMFISQQDRLPDKI